jgi:6-phosphogluconate dehydrogenase
MTAKVDGATILLEEDNLIKTIYENNCLINSTHLEKIRSAYTDLFSNEDLSDLKLLLIFEGDIEFAKDVSERYFNGRIRRKIGEALVSELPAVRETLFAASAIMGITHPVRVFESEIEAREWLESL